MSIQLLRVEYSLQAQPDQEIRSYLHPSSPSYVLCLVAQLSPTLCDPMDCSLSSCPYSPVFLLGASSWTEEPGGLQSIWSQRPRHDWATNPSHQLSSVAQSCPTLHDPMDYSTPGLPVHHQLPEFTQTHAHRVSDATQPSHSLSSSSPPAFNLSQHQGVFKWVSSSHQVAKVLKFQFQHQSFQWTLRTDLLWDRLVGFPCNPRDSQKSSPTPQFKSINSPLNQILYDYTVEVRNRFKGLDLIECLMNYGWRFMTLYRRQRSRSSPRKRNAKKQNGCLRSLTNSCEKKRSKKQRRKGKIFPFERRVPKNIKER